MNTETETETETETRVDEFAASMFSHLGYEGRLPDALVETYNDFKRTKDTLRPGRVSSEGFAFVVLLFKFKEHVDQEWGA